MDSFLAKVTEINDVINSFAWGWFAIFMLLGTGLICTVITKVFQISHIKHWWTSTIGSILHKSTRHNKDKGAVSQFQALCTALAATIGTGNIAGVAAAICIGGPGAVVWMWIAAFLGMMTNYSENILGIYFRRKNSEKEWSGGAMYYLKDGLGAYKGFKTIGKVLAVVFAIFAVLASFGIGNLGQINKITLNIESAFFNNVTAPTFAGVSVVNWIIGVVLMLIGGFIILGGLQRIASFAERIVPFMAIAYVIGSLVVMICHYDKIGAMFAAIFKFAFGAKALAGGLAGEALKLAVKNGCKRGIFSNEAGLGSSVMVHSNSCAREPVRQGLWGIAEVFVDTVVICTITALVVLTSGAIDLNTGLLRDASVPDDTLVAKAFGSVLGRPGEWFIVIAIALFAFTTVIGWSYYGSKTTEYLFGIKAAKIYRVVFVLLIVFGAIMEDNLAWDISDTLNGLMMIPNLIGIVVQTPLLIKLTKNYIERRIKGNDIEPMLSYDPDIQRDAIRAIRKGAD